MSLYEPIVARRSRGGAGADASAVDIMPADRSEDRVGSLARAHDTARVRGDRAHSVGSSAAAQASEVMRLRASDPLPKNSVFRSGSAGDGQGAVAVAGDAFQSTGALPHGQKPTRRSALHRLHSAKPSSGAIASKPLQAKLMVSQPSDVLEQEADRVAEEVMRMPGPVVDIHRRSGAATSAWAVGARGYAAGSHIDFGTGDYVPANTQQERLLPNGLEHFIETASVASDSPPFAASGLSASNNRVSITGQAQRSLQRAINFNFTENLDKLGTYTLKGQQIGSNLAARADIKITFSPDEQSPVTETIDFVQIAKPPGCDQPGCWANRKPEEKLKSDSATVAGPSAHEIRPGETLASISQEHYGIPEKAAEILKMNYGRLIWWVPKISARKENIWTSPLPVGVVLKIPHAVQGGFMVDIDPKDVLPRAQKTAPNISPNYPGQGEMTLLPNGTIGRLNGYKHADGTKHDSSMTDKPGGGGVTGRFEFETAAFAKDIGLFYGALKWGFLYSYAGLSNETVTLVPKVSDTFKAAMVSFNRVYRNNHIVRQGETLNTISIRYYGSTRQARMIYLWNRANPALPIYDPAAAIPVGTKLDVGLGPTFWDRVRQRGKADNAITGATREK